MKVQCPRCGTEVPVANIRLDDGWGKCEECQELFPLADAVPGFPVPRSQLTEPPPRPFDARAIVVRTRKRLLVHVWPKGMRATTWAMLSCATFWLGLTACWTLGGLGIFDGQSPELVNWVFASFSLPFWLIGFALLAAVVWTVWGTKSVHIDQYEMATHQRCLLWSRSRWIERKRVQHARPYRPMVKSAGQYEHAVEVVYRSGSFLLPADSAEEEGWLIAEINDFLQSLPRHPARRTSSSFRMPQEERITDLTRIRKPC